MTNNQQVRFKRSEVPLEQTWDLTDLFSSKEAFENELVAVQTDVSTVTKYKGQLHESSDRVHECLQAVEKFQQRLIKVATYASLRTSADGSDPHHQADSAKVQAVIAKISSQLSFIESELLNIPEETLLKFIDENKQLQTYRKLLTDMIQKKQYRLSAEIEEILKALSVVHDAPYMIYQRSKSADMEFAPIKDEQGKELPMSFALYEDRYELSPNTTVRRRAYESFNRTLHQYKNTYAATYATEVTKQVTLAQIRGYASVTDMLLEPQQVTREMYHNQLDIIQKELAPHMRKYIKYKQQQLGLDTMRFCDLQVSVDPNFNPKTTYDEATKIIQDALKIMGPDYRAIMDKAIRNRWIDYSDNIGKTTGAFCSSPYGVHPYILITWTDTMRGAFVLAHELGHAGHFYLAGQYQTLANTRPSTYFVEAPSTLNELLLAEHLFEKHKDDERMVRWIIDQLLGTYYHNFVTHLLEGEYQRRIYALAEAGKPLTANVLTEQKKETLQNFWGDAVEIDDDAGLTWMRQPHYYMGLYPYTYSAGLTVSTLVAQRIKEVGAQAVNGWLDVLKAGGTEKPLELIKKVGIDMSTTEPIKEAVDYVGSLINRLIDTP